MNQMARIIVVEDDPLVMNMTTELLQTLGHEVLQAPSGGDALEALRMHREKGIDLVLLDLSLPDYNGIGLLLKLDRYIAAHKIIVCSGDTSAIADVRAASPRVFFLAKPFSLQLLKQTVAQCLDAT